MNTGDHPWCSAMAPKMAGPAIEPAPATELLKANTVADVLPPISVTTPQVVVRLQSEKNLTKKSITQKSLG